MGAILGALLGEKHRKAQEKEEHQWKAIAPLAHDYVSNPETKIQDGPGQFYVQQVIKMMPKQAAKDFQAFVDVQMQGKRLREAEKGQQPRQQFQSGSPAPQAESVPRQAPASTPAPPAYMPPPPDSEAAQPLPGLIGMNQGMATGESFSPPPPEVSAPPAPANPQQAQQVALKAAPQLIASNDLATPGQPAPIGSGFSSPAPAPVSMPIPPRQGTPGDGNYSFLRAMEPIESYQRYKQPVENLQRKQLEDYARNTLKLTDPAAVANFINKRTITHPPGQGPDVRRLSPDDVLVDKTGKVLYTAPSSPGKKANPYAPIGARGSVNIGTGEIIGAPDPKADVPKTQEEREVALELKVRNPLTPPDERDRANTELSAIRAVRKRRDADNRDPSIEEARRVNTALASRLLKGGLDAPPSVVANVDQAVERINSGELSVGQAMQMLGGQRGGRGPLLLDRLAASKSRILPPKVRDSVNSINIGLRELDQMEELAAKISRGEDRVQNSIILTGYINAIGPNLSRANTHTGVLTQRDVDSSTQLASGWKTANFAPELGKKMVQTLREKYQRVYKATTQDYFNKIPMDGGERSGGGGGDSGGGGGTIRYTVNGRPYNIPAGEEAAFLKDKPNAVKVK